ncbi:MAG: fumarylacetoacetate hydrolase family protein [Candidatus Micrarchaeaceae archaeon]
MKIIRTERSGIRKTYLISENRVYLIQGAMEYLLSDRSESNIIAEVTVDTNSFLNMDSKEKVIIPYDPPEIWGSGISYYISRQRYTDPNVAKIGDRSIYEVVYDAERPEIFFKGTPRCAVPHNGTIRIRRDSEWTLPEPELAVVINSNGQILAYTIFDDVSARDIEAQNPLYLPESKIYDGSSAFGPYLVTPDEFGDPYNKKISMRIYRAGKIFFEGYTSTKNMKTRIEKQIRYLLVDNSIPDGTILTTGTSIIPGKDQGLRSGDVVEISIEGIGTLITTVIKS